MSFNVLLLQQGFYVLSKTNTLCLSLCIPRTFLFVSHTPASWVYTNTPVTWFIVQLVAFNSQNIHYNIQNIYLLNVLLYTLAAWLYFLTLVFYPQHVLIVVFPHYRLRQLGRHMQHVGRVGLPLKRDRLTFPKVTTSKHPITSQYLKYSLFKQIPTTGHGYHTQFKFYLPLVRLVHLLTLYVFSLPLQNVSKGEINQFHIALYFLTHAHSLPSQALPYFLLSDWARSHFYPFPSDWVTSPPNNWGYWGHTVYYALLSLISHAQKTGPTPCKFQSKVSTIERTGTQIFKINFHQCGVQTNLATRTTCRLCRNYI